MSSGRVLNDAKAKQYGCLFWPLVSIFTPSCLCNSPKKHSKRPMFQGQSPALYSLLRHWRTLIKWSQTSPTSEPQCPGANSKLSARPMVLLSLPDSFSGSAVVPTMYLLMWLYFWLLLKDLKSHLECPCSHTQHHVLHSPLLLLLSWTSHFAIAQLTLFTRVADHSIPALHLQCVFLFKTGLM